MSVGRVSSRGKALQSAVTAMKNFEAGCDRETLWLCEVEYKLASLDEESKKPGVNENEEKIKRSLTRLKVGCVVLSYIRFSFSLYSSERFF